MPQTFKQPKEHQVYFDKSDYQQMVAQYQREKEAAYTQQEMLIIAKGFFIDKQYEECLKVLKNINPLHSSKVLFERQSLQFRADYLLNRHTIPTEEDMNRWQKILNLLKEQAKNVKGPPIQQHHIDIFNRYADYLVLAQERLNSKFVLDNQVFKEQKEQEIKLKRYDGFPIYLLSKLWIEDFNASITEKQSFYLSPINNFSIVNDLFETYQFDSPINIYKNVVIFPQAQFNTTSKKYWNYLNSQLNMGKEISPIKRLACSNSSSAYYDDKRRINRIQPLIPVAIKCEDEVTVIQLTQNRTVDQQFLKIVEQKYENGQFKVKEGENWLIYDVDGPTQAFFLNCCKILHYNKFKLPKNVPANKLKTLLKFEFEKLPQSYLSDPANGLKGLENIGNSCYLNSCIQCLSSTQDLVEFAALNDSLQGINFHEKDGIVVVAFADLLKRLWNKQLKKESIYPRKFKKTFGQKNTQFREKTQEDAHQFLLCLLNSLHQELKTINSKLLRSISKLQITTDQKRVKEYFQKHSLQQNKSIIMNIFRGKIHNTMNCGSCGTPSHSYDVFLALTLPIPQKQSNYVQLYFCGWECIQTKKYRIFIHNITNAEELLLYFINYVKKKSEEEFYYVFGQISKQTLVFQQIALISKDQNILLTSISTEELLSKVQNVQFILYEMRKKTEEEILILVDYRFQKNGLVLGFPRLMYTDESRLADGYNLALKREIVANDRQNHFQSIDIQKLFVQSDKNANKSKIFNLTIQVIFKDKQKLFIGSRQIYQQINDPNIKYSIDDCFDLMRHPEVLEDSWRCGNCKKSERVQKRQQIAEVSSVLIIHLKRFKADYRKIKTMIEYPVRGLEIDRWIENSQEKQDVKYKYDLYAVCLHTGTAQYGHYKAYCKHFINKKWYQFDDGTVTQIEESKVVTPHAYMLFYKRVIEI